MGERKERREREAEREKTVHKEFSQRIQARLKAAGITAEKYEARYVRSGKVKKRMLEERREETKCRVRARREFEGAHEVAVLEREKALQISAK